MLHVIIAAVLIAQATPTPLPKPNLRCAAQACVLVKGVWHPIATQPIHRHDYPVNLYAPSKPKPTPTH